VIRVSRLYTDGIVRSVSFVAITMVASCAPSASIRLLSAPLID